MTAIARHLGGHEHTVRTAVKAFLVDGFDALPDRPRPGPPQTVTAAHLDALETSLAAGERTGPPVASSRLWPRLWCLRPVSGASSLEPTGPPMSLAATYYGVQSSSS